MRTGIIVGFAVLACAGGVLFPAHLADASPPSPVMTLDADRGPAGGVVVVGGAGFMTGAVSPGTLSLRWDDTGGPTLVDHVVPDAAGAIEPVTVDVPPDAAPGDHAVLAVLDPGGGGHDRVTARAAYTVVAPDPGSVLPVLSQRRTVAATPAADRVGMSYAAAGGAAGLTAGVVSRRRRRAHRAATPRSSSAWIPPPQPPAGSENTPGAGVSAGRER